jgi:hypothetical protein
LRLWPEGSPWINPGTMVYPLKQRWFASATQMANEPCYVDSSERAQVRKIYYHYGLDFGGCEGLVEVVAATGGSEILKVTDAAGRIDYDFAIVCVHDRQHPEQIPPTIHATYWPTFGVKPGEELTFKVRTFATTDGEETWDFGDGSPAAKTRSDGNVKMLAKDGYAVVKHRYDRPGDYLVAVQRTNGRGETATARLHVRVEPQKGP